jgi:hypothetical protein
VAKHLTPTELAEELSMRRREVISKCMELGVPIFNGRIDKELFLATLRRAAESEDVGQHEWVHLTNEQLAADPGLAEAVDRFRAPSNRAGKAAESWLKERAVGEAEHVATYVLLSAGEVAAFYSLGMGEVELRTQHREQLSAAHPRQGAVLILWLARAAEADIDGETILRHAVGISQIGARHVGAAVIALDPYDQEAERFWRERFGFRASRTRRTDADGIERNRLWMPLFPEG